MNRENFDIVCNREDRFAVVYCNNLLLVLYLEKGSVYEVRAYRAGILDKNIYSTAIFRRNYGLSTVCDMQVLYDGLMGFKEPTNDQMEWLVNHSLPTIRCDRTFKGNLFALLPNFLK